MNMPWQVLIYNALTRALQGQISRFKDKAYSGTYRADGKLLVAGSETGHVQVCQRRFHLLHHTALMPMCKVLLSLGCCSWLSHAQSIQWQPVA